MSVFEVYLPAGRDPTDSIELIIDIRDERDCLTQWTNLSSITVRSDSTVLDDLMQNIGTGSTNPFIQLLTRGSQNQVGQVINSLSQQITKMGEDNLQTATSSQLNFCSTRIDMPFL